MVCLYIKISKRSFFIFVVVSLFLANHLRGESAGVKKEVARSDVKSGSVLTETDLFGAVFPGSGSCYDSKYRLKVGQDFRLHGSSVYSDSTFSDLRKTKSKSGLGDKSQLVFIKGGVYAVNGTPRDMPRGYFGAFRMPGSAHSDDTGLEYVLTKGSPLSQEIDVGENVRLTVKVQAARDGDKIVVGGVSANNPAATVARALRPSQPESSDEVAHRQESGTSAPNSFIARAEGSGVGVVRINYPREVAKGGLVCDSASTSLTIDATRRSGVDEPDLNGNSDVLLNFGTGGGDTASGRLYMGNDTWLQVMARNIEASLTNSSPVRGRNLVLDLKAYGSSNDIYAAGSTRGEIFIRDDSDLSGFSGVSMHAKYVNISGSLLSSEYIDIYGSNGGLVQVGYATNRETLVGVGYDLNGLVKKNAYLTSPSASSSVSVALPRDSSALGRLNRNIRVSIRSSEVLVGNGDSITREDIVRSVSSGYLGAKGSGKVYSILSLADAEISSTVFEIGAGGVLAVLDNEVVLRGDMETSDGSVVEFVNTNPNSRSKINVSGSVSLGDSTVFAIVFMNPKYLKDGFAYDKPTHGEDVFVRYNHKYNLIRSSTGINIKGTRFTGSDIESKVNFVIVTYDGNGFVVDDKLREMAVIRLENNDKELNMYIRS